MPTCGNRNCLVMWSFDVRSILSTVFSVDRFRLRMPATTVTAARCMQAEETSVFQFSLDRL
jgi:hypothetical protein